VRDGRATACSPSGRTIRSAQLVTYNGPIPAELIAVIEAWDRLPEALRAGILEMVKAAP
jgi:hypothetical protein